MADMQESICNIAKQKLALQGQPPGSVGPVLPDEAVLGRAAWPEIESHGLAENAEKRYRSTWSGAWTLAHSFDAWLSFFRKSTWILKTGGGDH